MIKKDHKISPSPRPKGMNKIMSFENVPSWIREIPVYLKTQEMCKAMPIKPLSLAYVPDRFKTQEMCNEAERHKLCMMLSIPDHLCTQEKCNKIMHIMPVHFTLSLTILKHKKCIYIKAVQVDPSFLQLVPNHFKTLEYVKKL